MSLAKITYLDGTVGFAELNEAKNGDVITLSLLNKPDYSKIDYIDFDADRSCVKTGDAGYFLAVHTGNNDYIEKDICGNGLLDTGLIYFKTRADRLFVNHRPKMYVYGVKAPEKCFLGIITGFKFSADIIYEIKDGNYYTYTRFLIEGEEPYEEPKIEIHSLKNGDADYNGMAKAYRNYQLAHGCTAIKDRLNEHLKYSAESMYIRIRNAWKPVPTPVLEQTEQTEPPVQVACDFKRCIEIMNTYKKAGIDKCEFCLVGWNYKGHDGRWPQIMPAEPSLGGEEELRRLILEAEKLGYKITCHTNSTDAYSIAENFDINDMMLNKSGKPSILAEKWSGGRAYNICPKAALSLAHDTLPAVRDLGFRGMHYIDVISILPPKRCYNPLHPLNFSEGVAYSNQILDYAKDLFGGISSEGNFDHCAAHLDMVLYSSFSPENDDYCGLIDKVIPFWQLVYHGIILSNPYTTTVNAAISKNPDNLLKSIEFGARPVIYYNSRFVDESKGTETNWMGDIDFINDTDEHLLYGIERAKRQYEDFKALQHLQYEFMEKYEEISDSVHKITYSNGQTVTVDYKNKTYILK